MTYLEVAPNSGEQLSLLGEELLVTDDAILYDGSIAISGVRKFIHDHPIVDIEIFYSNFVDPKAGIEVYPLDSLDKPVHIKPAHSNLEDSYLKSAVSAVFVARALGKLN